MTTRGGARPALRPDDGRLAWPRDAGVHPQDFQPPPGLSTFYIRLVRGGGRQRQAVINNLDIATFAWVQRVIDAEAERRATARRPVRRENGHSFVIVPDGLQFALSLDNP